MKILVWSPVISLGGGIRLLYSLLGAMARHPDIDQLALAFPANVISSLAHFPPKLSRIPIPDAYVLGESATYRSQHLIGRVSRKLVNRMLPDYKLIVEQRFLSRYANEYDLVYAYWPHNRPFLSVQKPIICTFQDTTYLDFPEIQGGAAAHREYEYARGWVTSVKQIVVPSQTVKHNLIRHFGHSSENAKVIYHNILTTPPTKTKDLPNLPTLPKQYLIFPGNINAHKNHEMLLMAWSRFAERESLPLVLVGEYTHVLKPDWDSQRSTYWLHDRLAGLVRRHGLQHGRDFYALGYVSDQAIEQLIRNATGVIMPSLSEGGGSYPAEEALTYGVPLLCSDIPVMREHLSARSTEVIWFDPLSISSILDALHEFRTNFRYYSASAQSGMNDLRPSWDDVATQYIDVFKDVL